MLGPFNLRYFLIRTMPGEKTVTGHRTLIQAGYQDSSESSRIEI
jgi:hypothetical protein